MSDLPGKYGFCPYCGNKLSSKYVDERDRFFCSICERVIWGNPVPGAAVAALRHSEILLIKRGAEPWKDEWSLPAGFIEINESPKKAAIRELEEETCLKADKKELDLLEVISFSHPNKEHVIIPVYMINFSDLKGELKPGSDAKKACFKRPDTLEKDEESIRKDYREIISKAIARNQN